MLAITVGATSVFDEETSTFGSQGGFELQLEHSLVSLSKWEAIYEKPFLGKDPKSGEELLTYVKCMCLDPNIPPEVFTGLSQENLELIHTYIEAKRSATWFSEHPNAPKTQREIITSELIYYWMTTFQISFECEHWHLNRLFNLIRICSLKAEKPKKMSRNEVAQRNRELNAQRKRELGTNG